MTTRQAAARQLVESGYLAPAPPFPARRPTPDERPAVGRRIAEAADLAGFTVREAFARNYGLAKWRVAASTDPNDYYAELADVYSIGGLIRPLPLTTKAATTKAIAELAPGTLYAFQAVYADGKPIGAIAFRAAGRREAVNVTALERELKQLLG